MKYELCWKYSVLDYDMHQCRVLINFERDITDGNWRVVAIVLDIPPSRSIFWYFSGLLYNMKTEGGMKFKASRLVFVVVFISIWMPREKRKYQLKGKGKRHSIGSNWPLSLMASIGSNIQVNSLKFGGDVDGMVVHSCCELSCVSNESKTVDVGLKIVSVEPVGIDPVTWIACIGPNIPDNRFRFCGRVEGATVYRQKKIRWKSEPEKPP